MLRIHALRRNITHDIAKRTHSSSERIKYTYGIDNLSTNAEISPRDTPNTHVPIRSIAITYFVLPPLLIIPPPSIMFGALNGATSAYAKSISCVRRFTASFTRYISTYTPLISTTVTDRISEPPAQCAVYADMPVSPAQCVAHGRHSVRVILFDRQTQYLNILRQCTGVGVKITEEKVNADLHAPGVLVAVVTGDNIIALIYPCCRRIFSTGDYRAYLLHYHILCKIHSG